MSHIKVATSDSTVLKLNRDARSRSRPSLIPKPSFDIYTEQYTDFLFCGADLERILWSGSRTYSLSIDLNRSLLMITSLLLADDQHTGLAFIFISFYV